MELTIQITAVLLIAVMIFRIVQSYRKPKFYDMTQPDAFVGRMRYLYDNEMMLNVDKYKENIYPNTIKIDHKVLGIIPEDRKEVKKDGRKRKTRTVGKGRLQKRNGSSARSK
jgi:hypothetical protein